MSELKFGGVEKVAGEKDGAAGFAGDFARSAVESVAADGMCEGGEVDADLVSAAGVDIYCEKGELAEIGFEAALDDVVGDGFAASAAAGGHADAADGVAADGGGDGAFVVFHPAVD